MAFVKGKSGNPGGRPKDKPWQDALRMAALEPDGSGVRKLRRIAEAVVDAAIAGDMAAAREIGDRLDGKAVQAIEASVETTTYVVEVPALPASTEEWRKQHSVQ